MVLVTGSLTALCTIGVGLLAALIGSWICWKESHDLKLAGSVSSYGFSVAPLIILVWNCVAMIANDSFSLVEEAELASSSVIAVGNFDMALIVYAAVYSFFHVTHDIVETVKNW